MKQEMHPDGLYIEEDVVNKPFHYTHSSIEVIDIIEAFSLDFHLGNVIKYTLRAGYKDEDKELEDLKKARWYLERAISNMEKNNG